MEIESNGIVLHTLEQIQHEIGGLRRGVDDLRESVGGLQESVGGLREDVDALRTDVDALRTDVTAQGKLLTTHGERLAAVEASLGELRESTEQRFDQLHRDIIMTNGSIDVIHERLCFFERASTVATEGRARLDQSMERQHVHMNELDVRLSQIEVRVGVLEMN
jgi:chromosome segregation ATPase